MRRVLEEVRALVLERFPSRLEAALSFRDRLRAQLIRSGSFDGLRELAAFETALRAQARARRVRRDDGALLLEIEASLHADGDALRRRGERVTLRAPQAVAAALGVDELDVTAALRQTRVHVVAESPGGVGYEQGVKRAAAAPVADDRGRVTPQVTAVAGIRPQVAAAGAPLSPGLWRLRVGVSFGGFSQNTALQRGGDPLYVRVTRAGGASAWPSTPRRLARRVPGVPRLARAARVLSRRAAARGSPTPR